MIVAGIDVGSKNIHVVVLRDGEPASRSRLASTSEQEETAYAALERAVADAGLSLSDLRCTVATGVGRKAVPFAQHQVTEVSAVATGAYALRPSTRTIIDVGADEARAIRVGSDGKVIDFAVNEKCAAGTGAFVEAMSRALEVDLEELGRISLASTRAIPMNAQCTVFAESEVVSLIHSNTAREDIARAVLDAMAGRVAGMVRRAGVEADVVLAGGVARNAGFVKALGEALGLGPLHVLPAAEFVGAYGAALIAAARATKPAAGEHDAPSKRPALAPEMGA
jgi:benzoyl-CoA reductase subunit D